MHTPVFESRGATALHRAPAAGKLVATLVLVVFIALLPRNPDRLYIVPAAVLLVGWLVARMPFFHAVRRLLIAEVFILGMGLFVLFSPEKTPVFISAFLKSNLCVIAVLILGWTTPFHETIQVLRRAKLPPLMITTLALMHRYLPVLQQESRRMQRARASRTFGNRRGLSWSSVSAIIGSLFIRTADRAERIYLAMCARGWK